MNVKNCRVQIETIAVKVAAYNRGGKHMVDCLYKIGRKLTEILPDMYNFQWGHVGYTCNLKDSNVGFYGEAICFVPDIGEDTTICAYWFPVEEQGWEDAGVEYFLHGDFNKVIYQATRSQLKIMAKEIPGFIAALAETLDKDTEENKEATRVLLEMLKACGTTEYTD
jgi:hypothetical protein